MELRGYRMASVSSTLNTATCIVALLAAFFYFFSLADETGARSEKPSSVGIGLPPLGLNEPVMSVQAQPFLH